jgi:hypothetical protein
MRFFKITYFVFILIYGINLSAQNNDAEMEKILLERRMYNQANKDVEGFRIQIFNGLSENQARNIQSKFASFFPEIPSYLSYSQPEWKVQVGNFKVELEAIREIERIKKEFPTAVKLMTKIKI